MGSSSLTRDQTRVPCIGVQSLKAIGSSPKFCSLVFVYYSEFLVWVRKISPRFHNLAICFKYFFSVWILLIQIEGILFGTLLNSHMNVTQWGKNWILCPPYSLQDPMWAVTDHLSISLPVLLWPQASLEFAGFLQYSTFLSGRTLQILSSLCPELSSAIHHLWAPSHHSCFIWNITAERSARPLLWNCERHSTNLLFINWLLLTCHLTY